MIRNNLKTAYRNIIRHRAHSMINIVGLTIGIAIFFMIMMFIRHELSYDKALSNYDRIYKISLNNMSCQPGPLAPLLEENIPEIENSFRFFMWSQNTPLITYKDKNIVVEDCAHADSTFTSIFSFPIISGDKINPLSDLNTIVLTKSVSDKIFGNEDPIGKIVTIDNSREVKVTAILKDLAKNSTFQFNALISMATFESYEYGMESWGNHMFDTYLLTSKGVNKIDLQEKINHFFKDYVLKKWNEVVVEDYNLHTIQEVYFKNDLLFDTSKHGNFYFVQIFFIIGLVVLLVAIINFINLSSAKASIRAKEIGVRKVLGSYKINLISQFLTESILLSIISTFFALIIVELLKPFLIELIGINLNIGYLDKPFIILIILIFSILLGFVLGIFPALILSSIKIAYLFKNLSIGGKGGKISRAILIVIQFAISMILIISTIVIVRQLNYLKDKELGFNKENIVFLNLGSKIDGSLKSFKQELLINPKISKVAFSHRIPGKPLTHLGRTLDENEIKFYALFADPDYMDLMGLELIEGRNFSNEIQTDPYHTIILNETAVKKNQIENPVGKLFTLFDPERKAKIVGVMKDFHFKSLHHSIEPLALVYKPNAFAFGNIKIANENIEESLKHIEDCWNKFYPSYPFNFRYMDEFQESLYGTEAKLMRILIYFTFFAIFIACLGLFGLVSFITEQRSKEIGIRKVHGASIMTIVFLITKDITKWIAVAFIIACPLGYWFANKWLGNFAFQSSIPWWIYAVTGALGLLIGLLTLSFEAYKAAVKNPVDSIRYE